jgi:hypothetical protein
VTARTWYLAETRCEGDELPALHVFDDAGLASFLARNIEQEHYSGYSHELLALYRYGSGGVLTPLALHRTGEDRDGDDWLYWDYEVCAADTMHADGGHVAGLAFTVRIDGRA